MGCGSHRSPSSSVWRRLLQRHWTTIIAEFEVERQARLVDIIYLHPGVGVAIERGGSSNETVVAKVIAQVLTPQREMPAEQDFHAAAVNETGVREVRSQRSLIRVDQSSVGLRPSP